MEQKMQEGYKERSKETEWEIYVQNNTIQGYLYIHTWYMICGLPPGAAQLYMRTDPSI